MFLLLISLDIDNKSFKSRSRYFLILKLLYYEFFTRLGIDNLKRLTISRHNGLFILESEYNQYFFCEETIYKYTI